MGEDLFWAIRGGGGASFGIILSWKIKLVRVPPTVTAFTIRKKLEQGATKLVSKWQYIADKLHEDLFIRVIIQDVGNGTQKRVQASFQSLFLAGDDRLIPLMNESFPELGLEAQDCIEMNWIQSLLYFNGYQKGDR
ncbi:berberine bridge enzyme-like 22 [Quercus suber]|uniref:Berberine bridge enzyme-like 22 n=1 Tax=Quercus suber TaxID=58331 RepID=A0AAW0LTB6_QUESU